ncbi:MAG: antitoxin Xre/MbcA/ParS toxin-binding domain-containing protein [Bacteroidota bacterium]
MINYEELSDFLKSKSLVEEPFTTYGQVQNITFLGFPANVLSLLAEKLKFTNMEIQTIMGMSQSTFSRRISSERLSKEESERFLQIANIYKKGMEVFENESDFSLWLKTKNPSLADKEPIDMLSSLIGITEVEESLLQIEHGIYS